MNAIQLDLFKGMAIATPENPEKVSDQCIYKVLTGALEPLFLWGWGFYKHRGAKPHDARKKVRSKKR